MSSKISLSAAIVQMRSSNDPFENLFTVMNYVSEAESLGADLVCFPENCFYRGPKKINDFDRSEYYLTIKDNQLVVDSEFSKELALFLNDSKIAISLGSVFEDSGDSIRPFNTHLFSVPGQGIYSYRKMHLFDYSGAGASYKESNDYSAGIEPVIVDYAGWKFGLSICFDLRFPELYRSLVLNSQAQVLLAPSAFTAQTGKAHWHLLNQARAVENLSYMLSSAQWGSHFDAKGNSLDCYGHSLVVDPWGEVVLDSGYSGDSLFCVELLKQKLDTCRTKLPSLSCFCPIN